MFPKFYNVWGFAPKLWQRVRFDYFSHLLSTKSLLNPSLKLFTTFCSIISWPTTTYNIIIPWIIAIDVQTKVPDLIFQGLWLLVLPSFSNFHLCKNLIRAKSSCYQLLHNCLFFISHMSDWFLEEVLIKESSVTYTVILNQTNSYRLILELLRVSFQKSDFVATWEVLSIV